MYSWKREDRRAWELENRIPEKAAISQPYFSFNCMSHSDPLRSCGVLGSNSEERTTPEQCVQVSLRDRYTITSIELMASSENATKTHVKSSLSHCTIAKGGKIISSCSLSLLPWTPTAQGSFTRYIPAVCFTKQTVISGKTQLVSGEWWWGVLWREQWKQAPLSSLIARCHTILPTASSDWALKLTPTSSLPAARGCPETSPARSGRTCFPKLSTIQLGFQGHPKEPGSWGTAVPPPPPAVALLPINIPRFLFPTPYAEIFTFSEKAQRCFRRALALAAASLQHCTSAAELRHRILAIFMFPCPWFQLRYYFPIVIDRAELCSWIAN